MGYALAAAAARLGWKVNLVSGPVSLPVPEGIEVTRVVTGQEMYEAINRRFDGCDILIMTAAIMDYRPKEIADHKIKKFELSMVIEMEPVVDVLATVANRKKHQIVVGFAAETDHIEEYAQRKLIGKNADYIVANRIGGVEGAFERDDNTVVLISHDARPLNLGPLPKAEIASRLLEVFSTKLAVDGKRSST